MPSALEAARTGTPPAEALHDSNSSAQLAKQIVHWLDEAKAEEIVTIDLAGKTSIGDFMVIASGRTDRHVGAIADKIQQQLKDGGYGRARIEGNDTCDWVLIDTGDIIVHLFRPEVRDFYNLERMWSTERPTEPTSH
ncbi:MAG: ribosome silencing factor [Filomicrobium sp.]